MKLTPTFAALAAVVLSSVSLAAPTTSQIEEIPLTKRNTLTLPGTDTINFNAVRSHLDQLKQKYANNLKAFEANTGNVHPLLQQRDVDVEKRATGSLSLKDIDSEELWSGPITLGGQQIYVDFDTGSADIIINHSSYTPGSTAKNTGRTFSTAYGDGTTASGPVYTDNFAIAGLKASNVGFGYSSNNFLTGESPNNGIAGMSYPSLATDGSAPFFDALISAGAVTQKVFTFTLSPGTGNLYLGGVSPSAGTPTYVAVDSSQGFWGATGSINGKSTAGIIDTGTTVIVAPISYAQKLFASLPGVTQFQQDGAYYGAYNCNSPPSITVAFGSFSKKLSAATTTFGTTNSGQCVLSVVGENVGISSVIFGDAFLSNVHAIFDRGNNRVGFSSQ